MNARRLAASTDMHSVPEHSCPANVRQTLALSSPADKRLHGVLKELALKGRLECDMRDAEAGLPNLPPTLKGK